MVEVQNDPAGRIRNLLSHLHGQGQDLTRIKVVRDRCTGGAVVPKLKHLGC